MPRRPRRRALARIMALGIALARCAAKEVTHMKTTLALFVAIAFGIGCTTGTTDIPMPPPFASTANTTPVTPEFEAARAALTSQMDQVGPALMLEAASHAADAGASSGPSGDPQFWACTDDGTICCNG